MNEVAGTMRIGVTKLAVLAVIAFVAVGCGGSAPADGDGGTPVDLSVAGIDSGFLDEGWRWVNPVPQGNPLRSVWGASSDDVWAVGRFGTVMHWDGIRWRLWPRLTTVDLHAVAGSGKGDVWVGGAGGVLFHWDGTRWEERTPAEPGMAWLSGIWAAGPREAWAVGMNQGGGGTILRWDGVAWRDVGLKGIGVVGYVWGLNGNDVWAIGENNLLHHWDGREWKTTQPAPNVAGLGAILGFDPQDIWVVGTNGTALHWDGLAWRDLKVGVIKPGEGLVGLWGPGSHDLWAVGNQGSIVHWDGKGWTKEETAVSLPLESIWGQWAVGESGLILRREGRGWEAREWSGVVDPKWYQWRFGSVRGTGPNDVWFGQRASYLLHWDGTSLKKVDLGLGEVVVLDLWPTGPKDLWIIAGNHDVIRGDGKVFRVVIPGQDDLERMWASGPNDVWFVGRGGAIVRWDGTAFRKISSGTSRDLYTVWGLDSKQVWAGGSEGTFLRWDGRDWSPERNSIRDAKSIFLLWGLGINDRWVVADGIGTLHWDGVAWTETTGFGFDGFWGAGPNEVVGAGHFLRRWDGKQWHLIEGGTPLTGIWGSGPKDVWLIGIGWAILRRGP